MLDARLVSRQGEFRLDLSLAVAAASTMVVVGESGSGKTTLLRILAGLGRPADGRIELDGSVYFDSSRRIDVPAPRREIGYVAQDYALFPHLTAADNIAFGLRAQGLGRNAVRTRVARALERFGIEDFAGRPPSQLSGGQQQRVALARALVLEPRLLLLDEPLSALDLKTRQSVRAGLRRILAELPCVTIYVTHSPMEALLFGDQISVMEAGRIAQEGTRDDLLRHPRSGYVAEFMGVNLFRGRVGARAAGGLVEIRTAGGSLHVAPFAWDALETTATTALENDEVFVAVNPNVITLFTSAPAGSAQNTFCGPITEIVPEPPSGERLRVVLATVPPLVAEVTRSAVDSLGLRVGLSVFAAFKATGATTYR